jgi:hypothetical protein
MSTRARPESVVIDGVRYVPVSQAAPTIPLLEDAIISVWGGDNWREDYPDAAGYLHVLVTDDYDGSSGESVTEFLARLVQALPASGEASPAPGTPGTTA